MAWLVERRATTEDAQRLEQAAEQFILRHDLDLPHKPGEATIEMARWYTDRETIEEQPRLRRAWRQVCRRALRSDRAEGIMSGTVGYAVD